MNISSSEHIRTAAMPSVAAVAYSAVSDCATTPQGPTGSTEVRGKLTALSPDSPPARQALVRIRAAESAVVIEEKSAGKDLALSGHRVYMAGHQGKIARGPKLRRRPNIERTGGRTQTVMGESILIGDIFAAMAVTVIGATAGYEMIDSPSHAVLMNIRPAPKTATVPRKECSNALPVSPSVVCAAAI